MEEATKSGELGLSGILVWMRFMATRQLIWNKNYNVKPRYKISIFSLFFYLDYIIFVTQNFNDHLLRYVAS